MTIDQHENDRLIEEAYERMLAAGADEAAWDLAFEQWSACIDRSEVIQVFEDALMPVCGEAT